MLRETSTLMIVQIKSFPKEENIKLRQEHVSVPADVNYMYIPDKKTLKGEYTKYATKFLVKTSPVLFLLPLRCWNGCPKVSKSSAKESVRW